MVDLNTAINRIYRFWPDYAGNRYFSSIFITVRNEHVDKAKHAARHIKNLKCLFRASLPIRRIRIIKLRRKIENFPNTL